MDMSFTIRTLHRKPEGRAGPAWAKSSFGSLSLVS